MRRFALILCFLYLPAPVLAQEGCGDGCGCGEPVEEQRDISPPEGAQPTQVVDKAGNYKLTLPAGWEVTREAPEDGDERDRIYAMRKDTNDNVLIIMEIMRFTSTRAETFTLETPTDVLTDLSKSGNIFERFYGEGARHTLRPDCNEGITLGTATKSGDYEFRAIQVEEEKEIAEKEKLKRRGEKVEIPEYKPVVIRGRIALLSPHIYLVQVRFARALADDDRIVAEYKALMDSWEFLTTEEMPPPLVVGAEKIGDTKSDPANTYEKKNEAVYSERGRKTHNLQIRYSRPEGWVVKPTPGGNLGLLAYAQDTSNNWIEIKVICVSAKRAGEENKVLQDKKEIFETWATNWESKARGVKVPRKPQKFSLGGIRGAGYKTLEGTVEKFRGTWAGVLQDKSGWRTMIEIETRGQGDEVFKDDLKLFLKGLKVRPIK